MEEDRLEAVGAMVPNGSVDGETHIYDISEYYELYDKDENIGSIEQKVAQACNRIILPERSMFPRNLYETLSSVASSLGVPFEYVLQPLVSVTSNLMYGSIVVVKEPTVTSKGHIEPIIVNTLTLGAKSTNKSAAFKVFEEILNDIEREEIARERIKFDLEVADRSEDDDIDGPKNSKRPKIEFNPNLHLRFLKKCTESGLTSILTRPYSNKNITLMYEEFYVFASLLDFANPKSSFLPTYLEAYGGSRIKQTTQPRGVEEADNPVIQFMVYAQPSVLIKEMARNPDDPSGAWERQLIVNPKRKIVDLEECHQTPLSSKCDITSILNMIRDAHQEKGIKYKFDDNAQQFFYEVDRDMKSQMRERPDDTEFCGILGKDIVKIIRTSAIFCELRTVAESIDPAAAAATDLIDHCISDALSTAVTDSQQIVGGDDEMLQFLNDQIMEAVKEENFELALELKMERDEVAKGIHQPCSSGDPEIGERRFIIKLGDIKSALLYVKHCTGISVQLKAGARELAESQNRFGMGSPLKAPRVKGRNKNYWADDTTDVAKPFDFVMTHSNKVVKIWEHATNGQISMKLAKSKQCFPAPSSARPRGAQVEKELCAYFMKILVHHGLLAGLIDDDTIAVLPRAEEISEEEEKKFTALKKKHHNFKPFD